jgi:hypothetical protein
LTHAEMSLARAKNTNTPFELEQRNVVEFVNPTMAINAMHRHDKWADCVHRRSGHLKQARRLFLKAVHQLDTTMPMPKGWEVTS